MLKTWIVFKNEFLSTIGRKTFLLTLILIPLTSFIILLVISGVQKSAKADPNSIFNDLLTPGTEETMEGFIDESGLMKSIPPGYEKSLMRFSSEADAVKAVESSKISAYYLLPSDFLESGNIIYVRPDFNPLGGTVQSSSITALTAFNLTGEDIELAYRVQNPINVQEVDTSNAPQRDIQNPLTFFLPYIITFLFYIVILTSSTLLLNSITSEKQNRIMEVLMTSITPQQMLTGKIIALGLVGLIQTMVWMGAGLLMLRFSGKAFALSSAFQLPVSILLWGALFFLLGYAVYASLMAGIGALVPNLREASQTSTIVVLPMVVPLMFITALIQTPDSPLSVFLSLFPLTSPVSIMTRLAATSVPLWQIALAAFLLAATAFLLVRASAGLFRAQNLLSGKSISAKVFLRALIGK